MAISLTVNIEVDCALDSTLDTEDASNQTAFVIDDVNLNVQ